jgi:hypothetical protein
MDNPKCQANDSCTNEAVWQVLDSKLVKPHVCCDDCKVAWLRMSFLQKPGAIKFKKLAKRSSR